MNEDPKNEEQDNISYQESEKRVINCCITTGILSLLGILVTLTLVQVFMIEHQPIILMPQLNNTYGKILIICFRITIVNTNVPL